MRYNCVAKYALRFATVIVGGSLVCQAQTHVPLPDPIPGKIPASSFKIGLREVASGMVSPEWGTTAPGDDDHLYVVDQTGQIYSVNISHERHEKDAKMTLFLDLHSRLVKLGVFGSNYDERGLLGLAFHPHFRKNGLFYTFTSEVPKGKADFSTLPEGVAPDCQSVITEWRVTSPEDDEDIKVDLSSEREVMRIDKPEFNHNGGALVFGPDGMLYISLGDGGAANDVGPGHEPGGNGQSLKPGNVLGKILRIDPLGRDSANGKYGIPGCNPFVNTGGAAPEIYAYGFRNPFRISFDWKTGWLYAGDVGQNDIEEVDVVERGGNYGWPIKEGTFLFDNGASRPAPNTGIGFPYENSPGSPAGLTDPIAEYDHADGVGAPPSRQAIIGGYVYRGHEIRELRGHYVFGDYSGSVVPGSGHLFTLTGRDSHIENLKIEGRSSLGLAVLGFAEDERGELYLLANDTGLVTGRTGKVLKITRIGEERDEDRDLH